MDANLIPHIAEDRIRKKGYSPDKSAFRFRHLALSGMGSREIAAGNDLWIIVGYPERVKIQSNYGNYHPGNFSASEHEHVHGGQIRILNESGSALSLYFVQVIFEKEQER